MQRHLERAKAVGRTLLFAGAVVLGGTVAGRAETTITFGLVAKLAIQWPIWVSIDKGTFAKLGVKMDMVAAGGSARSAQQLAAGAIHIGEAGLPDLIRPIQQGAPIKIIAYEVAEAPYKLVAKKDIKSIAQLKGKKIMIGGSKDITLIFFQAMTKPHGLTAKDFDFVYAGATSARFAALHSGGVDATILTSPFDFQAIGLGYTNLGSVHTVLPNFPFSAYGVNTAWAAQNRAAVVAFLKGVHEGIQWLYDRKNKDEAVKILVKSIGAKEDDTAKTYDLFFGEIQAFRKDGAMPPAGFQRLLDALVELGDLQKPTPPMAKFVDDSFMKEALKK
jgi:NitT/TauT family transport system substrate-binding protein